MAQHKSELDSLLKSSPDQRRRPQDAPVVATSLSTDLQSSLCPKHPLWSKKSHLIPGVTFYPVQSLSPTQGSGCVKGRVLLGVGSLGHLPSAQHRFGLSSRSRDAVTAPSPGFSPRPRAGSPSLRGRACLREPASPDPPLQRTPRGPRVPVSHPPEVYEAGSVARPRGPGFSVQNHLPCTASRAWF